MQNDINKRFVKCSDFVLTFVSCDFIPKLPPLHIDSEIFWLAFVMICYNPC